jgi:hypothetical protein
MDRAYSPREVMETLTSIGGGKNLAAMKIIESLQPFVEEMQATGSIILRDKLNDHAELINKIYNDILKDGVAQQLDVVELRMTLKDLKRIYERLRDYHAASKTLKE